MLRFFELRTTFGEANSILSEGVGLFLITSKTTLVILGLVLLGLLGSASKRGSSTNVPVELLSFLGVLSGLLGLLDLLDVLDFSCANIDLPASFLLLLARLVVAITCSSLRGLLFLFGLSFLFFSFLLLLLLLLRLLLLLLALLLFEEGG